MSDFPALLKQYRERAGLSQSRLAARALIDHSYVSKLESGNRDASYDMVVILAAALNLDNVDRDHLLTARGFLPKDVGSLLDNEPSVGAVLDLLQDATVPLTSREYVRDMLRLITAQVRTPALGVS